MPRTNKRPLEMFFKKLLFSDLELLQYNDNSDLKYRFSIKPTSIMYVKCCQFLKSRALEGTMVPTNLSLSTQVLWQSRLGQVEGFWLVSRNLIDGIYIFFKNCFNSSSYHCKKTTTNLHYVTDGKLFICKNIF